VVAVGSIFGGLSYIDGDISHGEFEHPLALLIICFYTAFLSSLAWMLATTYQLTVSNDDPQFEERGNDGRGCAGWCLAVYSWTIAVEISLLHS
jgi:hypothetical protein